MSDIHEYYAAEAELGPDRSAVDRNDIRGNKNKYINYLRDIAILDVLDKTLPPPRILDFGCGSGNLTKTLDTEGYDTIGVDISFDMLQHTKGHKFNKNSLFLQYDGRQLPFSSNSFDACVTYGVLVHFINTNLLRQILGEILRVLKPGGRIIMVEQTCRRSVIKPGNWKIMRPAREYLRILSELGFSNKENCIIRRGHFPLIYFIRYGFILPQMFPYVASLESLWGKVLGQPFFDYADTMFVAEKS